MNKIYRLIGKEGRTTIPFDIRLKMRIGYNSLLSYEMKDENTIILRREKVCDHCSDHGVKEGSMDISTFEIQTGSYSTGRGFATHWRTKYEFTMNDGRSYEFVDDCFRSDQDALENMIKMKTLVDRQKITIEGVENLDKVIDDQNYTPEELELLYELFEVISE